MLPVAITRIKYCFVTKEKRFISVRLMCPIILIMATYRAFAIQIQVQLRETLTVYINKVSAGATLQLYNASGILVRSQNLTGNTQTIPVKESTEGLYFLMIQNGGQLFLKR
jgi:hypothetical protein